MYCLAFLCNNFGQLIHSKHLTDLVDNSKQQQSVKNSDGVLSIDCEEFVNIQKFEQRPLLPKI